MDFDIFIELGVSALLRALKNKKAVVRYLAALAKVAVEIERTAELVPDLAAAIERKRMGG